MDDYENEALPVGEAQVAEAMQTLQRYKAGKAALDKRIVDNELWFRMGHWKNYQNPMMPGKAQPSSGWLFNSIANKHADAMDNYPEPNVLPREADDEDTARALSSVLPVVLEQADYEQVYSDCWWRKLKQGTGVTGIFWDPAMRGGIGDIAVRSVNLLMLYWEPGVADIQASPDFFSLSLEDTARLCAQYPQLAGHTASVLDVPRYIHDEGQDTSSKSVVVDWYYKRPDETGRMVLHYCKFCNGVVLYASQNDPALAESGLYDHGQYPFVFDPLFVEEDSPAGFGYIDVMKDCQTAIDKMNHAMDENVLLSAKQRYVLSDTAGVNEEELADFSRDIVHVVGRLNDDSFRPLQTAGLQGNSLSYRQSRIEELKEISGNRDMTQGGTAGGVTAASAIAALQEAGSKLSRDMLKSAYRAFAKQCYLIIELMRQFYDEQRVFRIVGESGESRFVPFSAQGLRAKPVPAVGGVELGSREPIFDIVVSAAKKSTFSRLSQNETAKECYQLGFFKPENADAALAALEMMDFEGIEKVRQRVRQNGTLAQQLARMQQQMAQMAAVIAQQSTGPDEPARSAGGASAQKDGQAVKLAGLGNARRVIPRRCRRWICCPASLRNGLCRWHCARFRRRLFCWTSWARLPKLQRWNRAFTAGWTLLQASMPQAWKKPPGGRRCRHCSGMECCVYLCCCTAAQRREKSGRSARYDAAFSLGSGCTASAVRVADRFGISGQNRAAYPAAAAHRGAAAAHPAGDRLPQAGSGTAAAVSRAGEAAGKR